MLFKAYITESHEPEGGLLGNVNLVGDLPTYQVVCRIIDGVIAALGAELQETERMRSLVLDLVWELASEGDDGVIAEATHMQVLSFWQCFYRRLRCSSIQPNRPSTPRTKRQYPLY